MRERAQCFRFFYRERGNRGLLGGEGDSNCRYRLFGVKMADSFLTLASPGESSCEFRVANVVPLRFSVPFSTTERPDPLDHGEQEGRG